MLHLFLVWVAVVVVVMAAATATVVAGAVAAFQSLRHTGCLPTFGNQIIMPDLPVGLLSVAGSAVAASQAHVGRRILRPVLVLLLLLLLLVQGVVVVFLVSAPALSFLAALALVDLTVLGAILVEELEEISRR